MTENNRLKFEILRLLIYFVLLVSYMLVLFHRMAPAVASEDIMAAFNTTGASLGTLASMYFIIYASMQLPSGVLADTLGARTTVIAGNLLAGLGSVLFGLAKTYPVAIIGRLLVGFGVSIIFISIIKFISVWYSERRFALMSGVTSMVGSLGSIAAMGPLSAVLDIFSWRTVFVGIGVLALMISLIGYFIVRNRPEDFDFPPLVRPRAASETASGHHWSRELLGVLRIRALWPGFMLNLGIVGSIFGFTGLWGVPYLRDVFGMTRGDAAGYMTALVVALAVGSVFSGWVSDLIGRRKPVLLASALMYAGAWLAIMYLPWKPGLSGYVLFTFLGFSCTGSIVTFAYARDQARDSLSGMATSLVNTGTFAGTMVVQPLFGWLLDRNWDGVMSGDVRVYSAANYHHGLLLMTTFAMIGLIGALLTKDSRPPAEPVHAAIEVT